MFLSLKKKKKKKNYFVDSSFLPAKGASCLDSFYERLVAVEEQATCNLHQPLHLDAACPCGQFHCFQSGHEPDGGRHKLLGEVSPFL